MTDARIQTDALTTRDFTLVGPLGFLLTKDEWLDRYHDTAIMIGR